MNPQIVGASHSPVVHLQFEMQVHIKGPSSKVRESDYWPQSKFVPLRTNGGFRQTIDLIHSKKQPH